MKSIMQDRDGICYECKRYATKGYMHEHHVFGGSNRKLSEIYGLKVYLCYECHEDNIKGVHGQNKKLMDRLHMEGQRAFENQWGSREAFVKIFGKNYL